jgi:hypothetical protein
MTKEEFSQWIIDNGFSGYGGRTKLAKLIGYEPSTINRFKNGNMEVTKRLELLLKSLGEGL